MALAPETATVIRDGKEVKIPAAQVKKGDIFVVRPGQSIPVDGIVLDGASAVNEAALTGESVPVDKAPGDGVSAATVNCSGFLRCEATRVGEDTTLSQIIRMVSDAAATKAPIAKTADKVAGVFVPAVISIAVVTTIVWLLIGREFSFALARGISVLVISCPCALGLATPVAIMVGSGVGAKNGILFKTAANLEHTGRTRIVALDKTGTITSGQPEVTDLIPASGVTEQELLQAAVSLEAKSEHPLAAAIMKRGEEAQIQPEASGGFRRHHRQRSEGDGPWRAAAGRQRAVYGLAAGAAAGNGKAGRRALAGRQDAAAVREKRQAPRPHRRGRRYQAGEPGGHPPAARHGHPRRHADGRQCAHGSGHRQARRRR